MISKSELLREYVRESLVDAQVAKPGDKIAACVLVISTDGRVLAVSRKHDPNAWGLPGGKVDPGETPIQAARRECKEETGLDVVKIDPDPIHDHQDIGQYRCITYRAIVSGEIDSDEAGVIKWIEPSLLVTSSPFAAYNQIVLSRSGLM